MTCSLDRYLKVFWVNKRVFDIIRLHYQSSGSAPDENIKNTNMEGNCENEKND